MKMKYTKEQRKKLHKAFVAAKPYLSTETSYNTYPDKSIAICFAIDFANSANKITNAEKLIAVNHISECLEGCCTARSWLYSHGHISFDDLNDRACLKDIQTYRHRWLDHLIEQFKD